MLRLALLRRRCCGDRRHLQVAQKLLVGGAARLALVLEINDEIIELQHVLGVDHVLAAALGNRVVEFGRRQRIGKLHRWRGLEARGKARRRCLARAGSRVRDAL